MNDKIKKHLQGIADPVISNYRYVEDRLDYYETVIRGMRHLAAECLQIMEEEERQSSVTADTPEDS